MQHRITAPGPLHDDGGRLAEPGWACEPILAYDRSRIRAPRWRIKEWDYYCVLADRHGVAFTVADNGYMGFASVTMFDFASPRQETRAVMIPFPLGSLAMPPSSTEGDVSFLRPPLSLHFRKQGNRRLLSVDCPSIGGRSLAGEIELAQPQNHESMVIATPFKGKPTAFYYNQKINCLPARGELVWGKERFAFDPRESFGVLDWGRGVWTYANTWYWGSASGLLDGAPFGFNIGYGFGDTTAATENMLFYRGRAHKLEGVQFHIAEPDFLSPWKFIGSDGRFELSFTPILDRHSNDNFFVVKSWQHQVFGRFSGRVVLDDGTVLEVNDLLGFAEKVTNRW